nr:WXG100 family type VII secretion target [Actinophytocola sp.]
MPDGYTGEISQFTDAHAKVISVREDVDATLKQTMDVVMGLEGSWKGAAATAFNNMMLRFKDDSDKLNQALEAIAEQLQAAGSEYQTQEDTKLDAFGNLSSQLDG